LTKGGLQKLRTTIGFIRTKLRVPSSAHTLSKMLRWYEVVL